jgi:hypothetical protein
LGCLCQAIRVSVYVYINFACFYDWILELFRPCGSFCFYFLNIAENKCSVNQTVYLLTHLIERVMYAYVITLHLLSSSLLSFYKISHTFFVFETIGIFVTKLCRNDAKMWGNLDPTNIGTAIMQFLVLICWNSPKTTG